MGLLDAALLPLESWVDMPRTFLGDVFDRMALRGVRFLMAGTIWPPQQTWDAIRAAAEPYTTTALQRDPRAFFSFLDDPAVARVRVASRQRISGGQIVRRVLDAPYEPFHRPAGWQRWAENEQIPLEHWIHRPRTATGTVIALHGLGMGDGRVNAHGLMAQRWFDAGLDVVMPTLPLHGARTPVSARYSGELFMSWDAGRLNEAIRQAIHDVHLVHGWLATRSPMPVGVFGLSLGGYITALLSGLVQWPAFAIPMLAPVCIGSLAMQMSGAQPTGAPSPLSLIELQRAHRIHSPLTYPLAIARERALVIGGRGDRVVPPEHTHALWTHWGKPSVHWFSGGHTVLFRRARLMDHIREHLARSGSLRPAPARGARIVPFPSDADAYRMEHATLRTRRGKTVRLAERHPARTTAKAPAGR